MICAIASVSPAVRQPVVWRIADLEVDVRDTPLDAERQELVEALPVHGHGRG
jgi:hypothetical protein